MSTLGGTLIKLKDDIHSKWFLLQQSKRSSAGGALLDKSLYDKIVELGHQAIADLEKEQPDSTYIERIQNALHEVELKGWVSDESRMGMKVWYVMDPEKAQTAITLDINRLANEVHRAGMSLVKTAQAYCGCKLVEELEDLRSINTGVLRYCEGTLRLGNMRGTVFDPGDVVEHRPGAADSHANRVRFEPTEKGYITEMDYSESGDANWEVRQGGVVDFVEAKGGSCKTAGLSAKCRIEEASEEDIFELALFISQMKDIDLLAEECIETAFDGVKKQITKLKAIEPKERIWDSPWRRAGNMDTVRECLGKVEDEEYESGRGEEREERQASRYRRLSSDVTHFVDAVNYAVTKAKKLPCTFWAYERLACAQVIDDIHNLCDRIKQETDEEHWGCLNEADEAEENLVKAAEELVERCNPEPIILGLEATQYPGYDFICHEIEQIAQVCDLAGNEECLKVVEQVRLRKKEKIHPKLLPFKEFKTIRISSL